VPAREVSFRATREDTLMHQRELRHLLESLIREDRPLRPEERDTYADLLGKALLGVDSELPCPVPPASLARHWRQDQYRKVRTAADFLRFLMYADGPGLGEMWREALEIVLCCSARALEVATRLSAEMLVREKQVHEF
jgi:hypothetical protein